MSSNISIIASLNNTAAEFIATKNFQAAVDPLSTALRAAHDLLQSASQNQQNSANHTTTSQSATAGVSVLDDPLLSIDSWTTIPSNDTNDIEYSGDDDGYYSNYRPFCYANPIRVPQEVIDTHLSAPLLQYGSSTHKNDNPSSSSTMGFGDDQKDKILRCVQIMVIAITFNFGIVFQQMSLLLLEMSFNNPSYEHDDVQQHLIQLHESRYQKHSNYSRQEMSDKTSFVTQSSHQREKNSKGNESAAAIPIIAEQQQQHNNVQISSRATEVMQQIISMMRRSLNFFLHSHQLRRRTYPDSSGNTFIYLATLNNAAVLYRAMGESERATQGFLDLLSALMTIFSLNTGPNGSYCGGGIPRGEISRYMLFLRNTTKYIYPNCSICAGSA